MKKPQNVYMPIDRFVANVFRRESGPERSAWVTNFALTLADTGDDEFANELKQNALDDMAANRQRQERFRKRKQQQLTAVRVSGSGDAGDAPARSRKNLPAVGEFRNVRISAGETAALVAEFGDVSAIVEELSSYKAATGKNYKNDYAALRNWLRRRNAEGKRPDGKRKTQGDRLAQIFAERERRILDGDIPEDLLGM